MLGFRWARRVVAVVVLAVVGYVAVTFGQVWLASRRDQAGTAEAIVVLGAAQFNGLVAKLDPKKPVALLVQRENVSQYLVIKPRQ